VLKCSGLKHEAPTCLRRQLHPCQALAALPHAEVGERRQPPALHDNRRPQPPLAPLHQPCANRNMNININKISQGLRVHINTGSCLDSDTWWRRGESERAFGKGMEAGWLAECQCVGRADGARRQHAPSNEGCGSSMGGSTHPPPPHPCSLPLLPARQARPQGGLRPRPLPSHSRPGPSTRASPPCPARIRV